ncbi:MAG TPA: type II secretion system protein [Candidatus Paceibacterota bacterium]|nr:type II secretion system protein [Candidatus Paceibacterota bacterium]
MNKKLEKGFTLIELLVVIAIIGILAAMVITNLRTAREKARDASAITSMSSARAEAENYYDGQGLDYGGMCGGTDGVIATYANGDASSSPFENLMIAAANANGNDVNCQVNSTGQTYWANITMAATGDVFCIDSSGFAGKIDTARTTGDDECH